MDLDLIAIARKFFSLAHSAARNGGMWVSPGGGTTYAVAREIAQQTGVPLTEAYRAIEKAGNDYGKYWYDYLYCLQPPWRGSPEKMRFDASLVARAACRSVLRKSS